MLERSLATGERRMAQRQSVSYRLDVEMEDGTAGCVLDLSTTGMRVRFKQSLDISAAQSLRLELPRWLELGAALSLRGRFVWMRTTDAGAMEAGFAFDGLSRKECNVLAVLVQRLTEALAEDQAARD